MGIVDNSKVKTLLKGTVSHDAMLKRIPNHEEIMWKEGFVERYQNLTDFEEFKKFSLSFLRRAIRVNTLKISVEEVSLYTDDIEPLEFSS